MALSVVQLVACSHTQPVIGGHILSLPLIGWHSCQLSVSILALPPAQASTLHMLSSILHVGATGTNLPSHFVQKIKSVLGVKLSFLSKKCIFRVEKGIFPKRSYHRKMFSDPKYSFSVCQKYFFVISKKVNFFHRIEPNYRLCFSISKHKANTTELHPKVRPTC